MFGARPIRRSRIGGTDLGAEIAFLHVADGFHVELVGGGDVRRAVEPPADCRLAGWKQVNSLVDDMDRVIAHLAANGVPVAAGVLYHAFASS